MSDNDIQITFGGDASGVKAAAVDAAASIQSLGPAIEAASKSFAQMQKAVDAAFTPPKTGALEEQTRQAIKGFSDQLAAQRTSIQAQIAVIKEQFGVGQITRAQEWAAIEALHRLEIDAAQQAAQAAYQVQANSLNRQLALYKDNQTQQNDLLMQGLGLWSAYYDQRARIADQGLTQINQDEALKLRQQKQQWDQTVGQISRTFSHGLVQMAEGTKSLTQVVGQIGQQILQKFADTVAKSVSNWIFGEQMKTTATAAGTAARTTAEQAGALKTRLLSFETAEKEIFNNAASAASGAFKAFASNPLTLPFAPIAAAATFTAVEAFGNIASAAGGFDIPPGVNPLTQLHQSEMVLPASIANPVRDMVRSYNPANAGDPGLGGGGDTHNHLHLNVQAMDGQSVLRTFRNNKDHFAAVFREIVRGGASIPGLAG